MDAQAMNEAVLPGRPRREEASEQPGGPGWKTARPVEAEAGAFAAGEAVVLHRGRRGYRALKRAVDIGGSLAGMALLSPVFLVTAAAIRLEDGGPVFYAQERNGIGGKVFRMYKFRSMCRDAEKKREELLRLNELDGPVFKIREDPRVTRVGRFIRRTSIDELPQLWNILKGEMSLVGPRPLVTYETEKCSAYQRQRLAVKPGLTCYWQCSGRSDVCFDEWIEMDLKYIREASLWLDLKLILRTMGKVLRGDGAY